MRVAVVMLTSRAVSGGAAKHLRRVIPMLAARPEVESLTLFVPESVRHDVTDLGSPIVTWSALDARFGRRKLRRALHDFAADVVYIPTARWVSTDGVPVVVTVRNMEPLEAPYGENAAAEKVRNFARRIVAKRACRRSEHVIAVSNHVRDFLVGRWSIDPSRIDVVYHGVDQAEGGVRPAGLVDEQRPFLFTAGSIRPARGLRDLIGLPHLIAIGGGIDPGAERYAEGLRRDFERAGMADRVIWLGRLTPAEMSWCFSNARLFVMTSRAEACPNIVLEALSHGCLSVSTDQPPMPEFFRDAAIYYRRGDRRDLARAVDEALQLPAGAADAFRTRARSRAHDFTWEATVDGTVRTLLSAARLTR